MTKFNYPIKRGEPGFKEAVKAVEPGDMVTAVYSDPDDERSRPATTSGEAYLVAGGAIFLGYDTCLRHRDGDPSVGLAELVSVEKPSATVEELDALGRGSAIADEEGDIWVTDGEGTWTCMAGSHITRDTDRMVSTFGPITIVARAES